MRDDKMMHRSFAVAAILGAALVMTVLMPAAAIAGGFSNPDFGARRMGMFAVTARPDDVTAVFHNPAGLTLQSGTEFYHAQSWFFLDLGMKMYDSQGVLHPTDHEIRPDWSVGFIPFIGVASDLGTERLRVGFGIYAPNAYGAALPGDEPTRYHATRALFIASRATGSVAYKVSEKFSVGASLHLIYVYMTASRLMNPLVLQDPDRRFDDPSKLKPFDYKLKLDGHDWTWGFDLGVLFHPLDSLRIGAAFNSGSKIGLNGDVKLTAPDGSVTKARHQTDMTIPFALKGGINWEFAPDFELGADIYYWHYQVLQEQVSKLSTPIMGMSEFRDPKAYGNSWSWNTGLLYRVIPPLELMFGFQMDFTPIPSRTYSLDNPSTDQKGVSWGARWQINPDWRASLCFVRNWYNLVNVQDSQGTPPSNIKGHATNFEVAFDLQYKL